MTDEELANMIEVRKHLGRIADALELIARSASSVVCTVNEGEKNEEKALNIWMQSQEQDEDEDEE